MGCYFNRFHCLFQRVFSAAKQVRSSTEIGRHAASIPSVAVQLAERLFGGLGAAHVLLLGADRFGPEYADRPRGVRTMSWHLCTKRIGLLQHAGAAVQEMTSRPATGAACRSGQRCRARTIHRMPVQATA